MKARNVSQCPSVSQGASHPKRRWDILFGMAVKGILVVFLCLGSRMSYADRIYLLERDGGHEVEILEELEEAFIIKFPKTEIEKVERSSSPPTRLWREKRILWEDVGDYITISLPKERIAPPTQETKDKNLDYKTVDSLEEGLRETAGAEKVSSKNVIGFTRTGEVTGRILRHGNPVSNCQVLLSYVPSPLGLSKFFHRPGDPDPEKATFATTTDEEGRYQFRDLPVGEYDIHFFPPGTNSWIRMFSEKPPVTVLPGEILHFGDTDLSGLDAHWSEEGS